MKRYSEDAWERAMKVQEVILRAMAKKITWWPAAEILGLLDRSLRRVPGRWRKGRSKRVHPPSDWGFQTGRWRRPPSNSHPSPNYLYFNDLSLFPASRARTSPLTFCYNRGRRETPLTSNLPPTPLFSKIT